MSAPKNKQYKRSWKNLLLNKRYQLRFTLFMVGLSALLMAVLGWWVMREAGKATTIFLNMVQECPKPPPLVSGGELSGMATEDVMELPAEPAPGGADPVDETARDETARDETARDETARDETAGETGAAGERPRREVSVTTSKMTIQKRVNPEFVNRSVKSRACNMKQTSERATLFAGQRLILYVLIAVGMMLVIGLTLYGIKMTHRVAGPLHKISLYFAKLQDGTYDTVYNLRKGDQLVEFYDHFKGAHAGLRQMQEEDVAELRAILELAEKEDLAARSPELAAHIDELRSLLDRKEGSLV